MTRPAIVVVALAGAAALLVVFALLDLLTVGAVLTVLWSAAWLYRFWELR